MSPDTAHIFQQHSPAGFEALALDLFRYQAAQNDIYREYLERLGTKVSEVTRITQIPFLPIEFFKTHRVITGKAEPAMEFTSSGTTGSTTSRHLVTDPSLYIRSFMEGFRIFYGEARQYTILALLPSYLERTGSSLVFMVKELIERSGKPGSGFYLYDHEQLRQMLHSLKEKQEKTILIGVSFALLDLGETLNEQFPDLTIMETGGMKGKRKEMIREELHEIIQQQFGVREVHSEYGMTELLSQAYSTGNGIFRCPPWMKVMARDTHDPFSYVKHGQTGGINVIDLANIHSCAFIATQDLAKVHENGTFEVLGRFDSSDIRGCNLLIN